MYGHQIRRAEMTATRDRVLRDTRHRPDPVDVALQNAAGMSEDELRAVMEGRRASIAAQLASWQQLHDTAAPFLTGIEEAGFRHTLIRVEAELAWHEEFIEALPKIFRDSDSKTNPG